MAAWDLDMQALFIVAFKIEMEEIAGLATNGLLDKIWHQTALGRSRPVLPSVGWRTVPCSDPKNPYGAGLTSQFSYGLWAIDHVLKQESPSSLDEGLLDPPRGGHGKIWHRPTLPHFTAVPSALAGLTSLFGPDSYREGRDGCRR